MLKRIAKYVLMASMILGTSNAVAEDATVIKDTYGFNPVVRDSYLQVNARYAQYFGHLDTGIEGSTSKFRNFGETGIQFRGNVRGEGVGSASFFVDIENRSGLESYEFWDVIARASYITPVGRINIGKVTNYMAQITLNPTGGAKASAGSLGTGWGSAMAGLCENDGIDWIAPLFKGALLLQLTYWDKACSKFRTMDVLKSGGFGLNQSDEGMTMAFGGRLKLGPVKLKAGITQETLDDYSKDTDTAEANTYSMASGQVTFGSISVNANVAASSIKNINKLAMATTVIDGFPESEQESKRTSIGYLPDADSVASLTGLGFKMKDLGPGDLNLNYEAVSVEENASAPIPASLQKVNLTREMSRTSLFYTVYISKKIGYQFAYSSRTTTLEIDGPTTRTFIGGSLFGRF